MHHFFINKNTITGSKVVFSREDYMHMTRVLRMKAGEKVTATDGEKLYHVELTNIENEVIGKVISVAPANSESPIYTTLVQALAKGEKMDLIIQKATELGVNKIIPVETSFSIVRLDNKKKKERSERWQKIANEAAKQSKRCMLPIVENIATLEDTLRKLPEDALKIILWESENDQGPAELFAKNSNVKQVAFIIGPEGGFTSEEVNLAKSYGIHSVMLGKRILRTETAGITALAIAQFALGDLGGKNSA